MRLIITRPLERARLLSEKLMGEGYEALLAPMLRIENRAFEVPDAPLQALMFTSVQGVEAVAGEESIKIFPAITVGSKTAGAAALAGFETVHNADGNVEDLYKLILEKGNAGKGLLLHMVGDQTTGKLVERLVEKGFQAERRQVYETRAAKNLPSNVAEKIKKRKFDGVLFFSPRTAHIFNQVIRASGLEDHLSKAFALCLSRNVADIAAKLSWKKIYVSEKPTEQSLITLLQGLRK